MTTRDYLKDARTLLTTKGWTKGNYCAYKGQGKKRTLCYCAMGAINEAVKDDAASWSLQAEKVATALITNNPKAFKNIPTSSKYGDLHDPHGRVVLWNDRRERTVGEVLNAFTNAIRKLGKQEQSNTSSL